MLERIGIHRKGPSPERGTLRQKLASLGLDDRDDVDGPIKRPTTHAISPVKAWRTWDRGTEHDRWLPTRSHRITQFVFPSRRIGLAALYHHFGIDSRSITITDLNERPQFLVEDHARPLAELV